MWLIQYNRRWLASSEVLRGVGILALQFLLLTDDLYHQTAMSAWLIIKVLSNIFGNYF